MAYVYRHIRLDKNEPFYIGIGSDSNYKRAYITYGRNKLWKNVASKTDYEVEIICDDLEWEEACSKEIEFIYLYGRKDNNTGCLCNLTGGGDGRLNYIMTEEAKINFSKGQLGNTKKRGKKLSNITKKKMSEARKKYYENGGIKIFPINHGNNFRGKIVVNLQNGIFYENIKSAAESLNIKRTTLEYRLKKNIDQHFCYA